MTLEKKKVAKWFKDYHNVLLIGILIFALILRLYYFVPTLDQTVWWDEAEYMNMAKAWAFGLDYDFIPVRPVLFSLLTAVFLKISSSEFLPRFLIFLLSMASVFGMYCLGKEFYNKKVGLLSAFFTSVFWMNLFFSFRLLVDLPSMTFFIFSILFFYRYLKKNSNKDLYIGAVIVALGVLFRISTGIFLVCFLLYLLFTQKLLFVKKKELWIAGAIFLLVLSPYLIWGYMQFGGFVIKQAMDWGASSGIVNSLGNLKFYLLGIPSYLSWPLLLVFLLGLFSMYKVFLGLDVIFKGKGGELNKELFLILLFLLPILSASFSLGHPENRYIITTFPAIFIISSKIILKIYKSLRNQKVLAIIGIILLLSYVGYSQIKFADSLIKQKVGSYSDVQKAGEWCAENLPESASIITKSWPQMMYYSNQHIIKMPTDSKEKFLEEMNSVPKESYYMVSMFESHTEWMLSYPREKGLIPVMAYFLDSQKTQPSLIIYNMSSSSQSSL
jgi:4-amino-4-deoxy-L-arabinose transferase-like glycosyltransferase